MLRIDNNINKVVFITSQASEYVNTPDSCKYPIITADSSDIIRHLMPKNDISSAALIYCDYSELVVLSQIVDMFNKPNFTYIFAVNISGNSHELISNAQVALAWEGVMTEAEFRFTTSYQLSVLEQRLKERQSSAQYLARLLDMKQDQEDLIKIGRSLSLEKDMSKLLRQILMLSKKITGADAGSIYLVEQKDEFKQIRFKYSHTFSKDLPLEEFVIPFNTKSIAGYSAVTGKVLNIPDVYMLSPDDPISFNKEFDISNNYRSKSMLVVPMRNHMNDIIGVVQLINSKEPLDPTHSTGNEAFEIILQTDHDFEKYVCSFDKRYESLME